ncbi:hypothetical protein pdam_00003879 [Pocillopora damicornis]|uniref:Uncharacterized protein n=1 Tax=Pocillopora damicornis TaxID=46731 RepID=A0A3M6U5X7_POCDA|nr:hypothetical protein pdam_00003879 [Pocillopora damicornis]
MRDDARDITDETNESIVMNPKKTQAVSPKIQLSLIMVTTVIGMFNMDTSKSANARLRRKPLEMVRRVLFLKSITNKMIFTKTDATHITTRMVASMIALDLSVIFEH